jgi:hypothetical protein
VDEVETELARALYVHEKLVVARIQDLVAYKLGTCVDENSGLPYGSKAERKSDFFVRLEGRQYVKELHVGNVSPLSVSGVVRCRITSRRIGES